MKFLWFKFRNPVRSTSFQLNQWISSTVCIKKKFPIAKFLFSSSTLVLFLKYSFVCLLSHWVLYFLDCLSFLTLWVCLTYSFPFAITFFCLYLFLFVFIASLVLWWLLLRLVCLLWHISFEDSKASRSDWCKNIISLRVISFFSLISLRQFHCQAHCFC